MTADLVLKPWLTSSMIISISPYVFFILFCFVFFLLLSCLAHKEATVDIYTQPRPSLGSSQKIYFLPCLWEKGSFFSVKKSSQMVCATLHGVRAGSDLKSVCSSDLVPVSFSIFLES